jgi:hypothetical protein
MYFAISWVIILILYGPIYQLITLAASSLPTPPINDDLIDQSNPEMFLLPISDTPSSWRTMFMFSAEQDRVCSCSSLYHQRVVILVTLIGIPHVHV